MYLLRMLALFATLLAISLTIPLLVAVIYQEPQLYSSFLIPIFICFAISFLGLFITRAAQYAITPNGGFLFATGCWIFAASIGALPFYLSGVIPNFANAFFESMSGFTTTGASILTDIERLPYALLFWRSFTHWLGGMGIIVLFVAIQPFRRGGGERLIQAEITGLALDKTVPKIGKTAKILWITYCIFTVLEIILLKLFGMSLFDAITHSFGTMATGGFSTKNGSIGHYQSNAITLIITIFMIFAGINFNIYYRLFYNRRMSVLKDPELKGYIYILLIAACVISVAFFINDTNRAITPRIITALFHTTSILTTTGYVTENFNIWPLAAQAMLLLLMFCGASSGSTGGGIKIIRLMLLSKQGEREMKYLLHPQGIFENNISGYSPERRAVVQAAAGFVFLYLFLVMISMIVVAFHGYDLLTSLSSALATIGNIGPGFGRIGAVENYAHFPAHLKYYFSFMMLCGRLEIFTVLILFMPSFWRRKF